MKEEREERKGEDEIIKETKGRERKVQRKA